MAAVILVGCGADGATVSTRSGAHASGAPVFFGLDDPDLVDQAIADLGGVPDQPSPAVTLLAGANGETLRIQVEPADESSVPTTEPPTTVQLFRDDPGSVGGYLTWSRQWKVSLALDGLHDDGGQKELDRIASLLQTAGKDAAPTDGLTLPADSGYREVERRAAIESPVLGAGGYVHATVGGQFSGLNIGFRTSLADRVELATGSIRTRIEQWGDRRVLVESYRTGDGGPASATWLEDGDIVSASSDGVSDAQLRDLVRRVVAYSSDDWAKLRSGMFARARSGATRGASVSFGSIAVHQYVAANGPRFVCVTAAVESCEYTVVSSPSIAVVSLGAQWYVIGFESDSGDKVDVDGTAPEEHPLSAGGSWFVVSLSNDQPTTSIQIQSTAPGGIVGMQQFEFSRPVG